MVSVAAKKFDAPIGDSIILTCHGASVPRPSSATWSRNGTLLSNSQMSMMIFNKINSSLSTSTLIINTSRHEDSGNYICLMNNTYSSSSSQVIQVTVLGNLSI